MALAWTAPLRATIQGERVFTPEMFGARGDGVTNDSRALAALAAAVNAQGGGIVEFRRATYLVGEQQPAVRSDAPYAFEPAPLLVFEHCRRPLVLRGNGATLKCADGLRYGVFDPRSGRPLEPPMPYVGPGLATPYYDMIRIESCSSPVEVSDFELDGNLPGLLIGGRYGDTGWQIPARGLSLFDNRGPETVRNVFTHHHGQDGLYIDGWHHAAAGRAERRIVAVRCEHNGRQGCSIVGGHGYAFERCRFAYTGRAGLASAPGAGVDIEAEAGKTNRGFSFTDCMFDDNVGSGLVADSGDSADMRFARCRFIGTTNWSAWPNKPGFRFDDCTFVGALVRAYGDPDQARAAQFHDCTFTDDRRQSPTGRVYGGTNPDAPLADLSDARNVLFSRCHFLATTGALPWSIGAIYADCRMEQRSGNPGYPRGRFVGRNLINGRVDLYGSRIEGELIVNGRRIPNS
jgi:hypothetical protein